MHWGRCLFYLSVMLCVSVSSVSVDCVTVTSPYSPSADPEEPGLTSEY